MTLVAGVYLLTGGRASSSGKLTTSQDTEAGQVRVKADGDVLYLTNETQPGGDSTALESQTATTAATVSTSSGRRIFLQPPQYADNIGQVFSAGLNLVLIICVLLVFGYIVIAAVQWITSGGDKAKTEKSRQMIVNAVIGLIIVVSSYAVINLISRFIGFNDVTDVVNNIRPIRYYNDATPSATPNISPSPSVSPE
jgi:hypothetical protein